MIDLLKPLKFDIMYIPYRPYLLYFRNQQKNITLLLCNPVNKLYFMSSAVKLI